MKSRKIRSAFNNLLIATVIYLGLVFTSYFLCLNHADKLTIKGQNPWLDVLFVGQMAVFIFVLTAGSTFLLKPARNFAYEYRQCEERAPDLITKLRKTLPDSINFEGCYFVLELFGNGKELRLCYSLFDVDKESEHYEHYSKYENWNNPFIKNGGTYYCGFLFLFEAIYDSSDLEIAIDVCETFLKDNNLMPDSK